MTMISQKCHNCVVLENNSPNCVTASAETANMVSCSSMSENVNSSFSPIESTNIVPFWWCSYDPNWMPIGLSEEESDSNHEDSPVPHAKNNHEATRPTTEIGVVNRPNDWNDNSLIALGTTKKKRNHTAVPSEWMDNKQKRLREKGKTYTGWAWGKNEKGKRGNEREERKLGPTCNSKFCIKSKQRKCQDIGEASRELIFTKFWETL